MLSKLLFSDIQKMLPSGASLICNNPEASISSVQEWNPQKEILTDCLYICNEHNLRSIHTHKVQNAILALSRDYDFTRIKSEGNIIALESEAELYKLTTRILSKLSDFAKIGSESIELQKHSSTRTPLEDVMKYAYKVLGNPIVLTDSSFLAITKLGLERVKEDHWVYAAYNGSFPTEFISNYIREDMSAAKLDAENEPLYDDVEALGMSKRQASVRITFEDRTIAFLFVLENNKPFSESDEKFIQLLGYHLSNLLGHSNQKLLLNTSFHEDFLMSILSEAITSPEEILLKQETFGIKLDQTLRIIAIDMPLAVMDSDMMQDFIRKLRIFFNQNCIVPYENTIVILMDTPDDGIFLSPSQFKGFELLLSEYDCKANVSSPFHYLHQTKRHYMQAMMCSTIRSLLHIDKPILGYHKEIAEYHMIFNYSMVQNLDNLLHPAVIKLRKLDKEQDTDMLDTMFAYTDHLCNLTATAKALYLHYNTLKYRIEKIASITNVDFTSSADVHRIVLSKKVLEIEEALGRM